MYYFACLCVMQRPMTMDEAAPRGAPPLRDVAGELIRAHPPTIYPNGPEPRYQEIVNPCLALPYAL